MTQRADELLRTLHGYRLAAPVIDRMRAEKIRGLDTAVEITALSSAYLSAKASGFKKPPTGLTRMRAILDKIGR